MHRPQRYGKPELKSQMGLMEPEPEPEPGFSLPAFSFPNPFEAAEEPPRGR